MSFSLPGLRGGGEGREGAAPLRNAELLRFSVPRHHAPLPAKPGRGRGFNGPLSFAAAGTPEPLPPRAMNYCNSQWLEQLLRVVTASVGYRRPCSVLLRFGRSPSRRRCSRRGLPPPPSPFPSPVALLLEFRLRDALACETRRTQSPTRISSLPPLTSATQIRDARRGRGRRSSSRDTACGSTWGLGLISGSNGARSEPCLAATSPSKRRRRCTQLKDRRGAVAVPVDGDELAAVGRAVAIAACRRTEHLLDFSRILSPPLPLEPVEGAAKLPMRRPSSSLSQSLGQQRSCKSLPAHRRPWWDADECSPSALQDSVGESPNLKRRSTWKSPRVLVHTVGTERMSRLLSSSISTNCGGRGASPHAGHFGDLASRSKPDVPSANFPSLKFLQTLILPSLNCPTTRSFRPLPSRSTQHAAKPGDSTRIGTACSSCTWELIRRHCGKVEPAASATRLQAMLIHRTILRESRR